MEIDLFSELPIRRQRKTATAHGDYATPRGWELLYGERVQEVASQVVSTLRIKMTNMGMFMVFLSLLVKHPVSASLIFLAH